MFQTALKAKCSVRTQPRGLVQDTWNARSVQALCDPEKCSCCAGFHFTGVESEAERGVAWWRLLGKQGQGQDLSPVDVK